VFLLTKKYGFITTKLYISLHWFQMATERTIFSRSLPFLTLPCKESSSLRCTTFCSIMRPATWAQRLHC